MDSGAAIPAGEMTRRYDIDFLRVFAFSLLILYHVGMFYVAEWGWHVKSAYQAEWLQWPMTFTNQWRMSLLFVISGLALSFVWQRYAASTLAWRRLWRLFVPLVFAMAFIVAPQPYFEALSNGVIEPGFWRFMGQYLTFHDFPGNAWGGEEEITWTWNHLWYVAYLLCYTQLLILLLAVAKRSIIRLQERFQSLRGVWVVLLPVVPLMVYGQFIFPHFPYISHGLLDDWYAHAMYFTFFAYGFLIGNSDGWWDSLVNMRRVLLVAAILMFVSMLIARERLNDDPGLVLEQFRNASIYLNRWLWILVLLAWGKQLFNRPLSWLPYATAAIFPWYILHQTITVVAGYQLSKWSLGPVAEPALVLFVTVAGCYVGYEYVIRRIRFLRPLFGVPY